MKVKLLVAVGCLTACMICPAAFAQDYHKFDVFMGYSLSKVSDYDNQEDFRNSQSWHVTIGGTRYDVPRSEFKSSSLLAGGFAAAFTYNFNPTLGLETALRYNSGRIVKADTDINDIKFNLGFARKDFAFLIGPRLSFGTDSVKPFLHGLVGLSNDKLSVSADVTVDGRRESILDNYEGMRDFNNNTSFAFALGGGLDVSVSEMFAIRVIQADYYITSHPKDIYAGNSYDGDNKIFGNINLSFGVVLKFGR